MATYDLAVEWARYARVDVLTSWFKGLPLYEIMDGIHVHRVRIFMRRSRDAATFISMLSYLPFGFFKGISLCVKHRYDVINTHFAVPSGPLGYVLGKIFKIPNVLSLHGGDIYDPSKSLSPHRHPLFRRVVRFILDRADRIVAQSSNTRDNAVKYYRPRKDISIVPLAFHPPVLRPKSRSGLGIGEEEFACITVGRLIRRKAIDVMIEAMGRISQRNISLLVVGDGPEGELLRSQAERSGLQERVRFLGHVADDEKYRYISNADLFVSTSLHEGFGIVFMEAMYCGLPIVCSNHGGQVDFLAHEENALLIDVGDVEACAASIVRFYRDRDLYARCSRNNTRKVKDFYADSVAKKYLSVFNDLSSGSAE